MNIIYLHEERCFGELISMGAYFSRVVFTKDGIEYDSFVENDEFEFIVEDEREHDE